MIESVSSVGIGPFKRPLTFLVSGLGLVLIRGDNRVSSAADSNGCGKTGLFSFGLSWGAFGETLAGEKGDEVLNRFSKGPGVNEIVGVDPITKARWRVIRGRRPKRVEAYEDVTGSWKRVLEEADDRDVNAWVEARYLPWRIFRNAVVFDRDVRFTRAGQDEQMRMLDRIQGVDFRAALDRAKAWRGIVAEALASARANAAGDASTLEEVRGQVAEMERLRDGFRADVKQRVVEAEAAVEAERDATDVANRSLGEARGAARKAKDARVAFGRVQALYDERDRLAAALQSAERDVERAEDDLVGVTRKVAELITSGKCAACRQPTKDAAKIGAGFTDDVEAATKRRRGAAADVKRCLRAEAGAAEALDAALKGVSLVVREREVRDLEAAGSDGAVRRAEEAVDDAGRRLTSATEALARVRSEKWAGAATLRVATDRVESLTTSVAKAEKDAEKHARWLRVAEYWVEAFGDRGVRSLLFDSVAGFLTERAAFHLEALAGGEASLAISALTDTKKGTRERLSIVPDWAWGGVGQNAESGGQDCRSDLAVFASLQDLAATRSARRIEPHVYDEPEGLDARGQEMFGAWLASEARRDGSTTFVMTHNPALASAIEADEEWRVILHGPGDATLEREK